MEIILAKYGEIALKGLNKNTFENVLIKNIRRKLKPLGDFELTKSQSTIYIIPQNADADLDEVYDKLKEVFGIATLTKAAVADKNLDSLCDTAVDYLKDVLMKIQTFKVESKRADKSFPYKSPEICAKLGEVILKKYPHLKVDVKNPDFIVNVEIRDTNAYVQSVKESGARGLPVGTGGKAALLLSGGIDSPVAAYMMAKRGLNIDAIHFESPPYTSERAKLKVKQLCEKLKDYCGTIVFYCVPFTEIQTEILKNCPEEFFTVIMRRLMMEIAQIIARDSSSLALVTGESLGQVASQTLNAIACTDAVCSMPVLRPLIGLDKVEIVDISRKIGTFDISILPYEDCCTVFTPKHPKVKPLIDDIEKAQSAVNFTEMIKKAIENTEKIIIGCN